MLDVTKILSQIESGDLRLARNAARRLGRFFRELRVTDPAYASTASWSAGIDRSRPGWPRK